MARHKLSPLGSVILNSMFLVHSGKICRVGAAGPSLRETHLSDAAGVCALHGLNLKHPETSDSSVNQDVRQSPLGQGLVFQHVKLHPYYPLVWMKGFLVRMNSKDLWARMKSWNHTLIGSTLTMWYVLFPGE